MAVLYILLHIIITLSISPPLLVLVMHLHVECEARLCVVGMATYGALKGSVTIKYLLVLLETLLGQELHLAARTLIFLFILLGV